VVKTDRIENMDKYSVTATEEAISGANEPHIHVLLSDEPSIVQQLQYGFVKYVSGASVQSNYSICCYQILEKCDSDILKVIERQFQEKKEKGDEKQFRSINIDDFIAAATSMQVLHEK